jgi:small conductance mechanosensitive channel
MDLRTALASNFNLQSLALKGVYVLCIAVSFEVIAWWSCYLLDRQTAGLLGADAGREHNWRMRRRSLLKRTPKIVARCICYAVAIILVFDVFGVPVLPLSLAVGAIIALVGAGMLPLLRDAAQGYALLAEDALAVGDVIHIDGHEGVVERFNLRGVTLRDSEGRAHIISNREIQHLVVMVRRAEAQIPPRDANALPGSSNPGRRSTG